MPGLASRALLLWSLLAVTLSLGAKPLPTQKSRPPHNTWLPIRAHSHGITPFEVAPEIPQEPFPVDRFELLRVEGRPSRIPAQRLPWLVHAGELPRLPVVDRAISLWNRTGLDLGLGYLFQRTDDPSAADLVINWHDPGLPKEKAAATWWGYSSGQRRVLGLSMDGSFPIPEGNVAQILSHELGHVLGLGESYQVGDMMFFEMDRRRLRMDQLQLSLRDKLALRWLYQQSVYAPIRSRRD